MTVLPESGGYRVPHQPPWLIRLCLSVRNVCVCVCVCVCILTIFTSPAMVLRLRIKREILTPHTFVITLHFSAWTLHFGWTSHLGPILYHSNYILCCAYTMLLWSVGISPARPKSPAALSLMKTI